MQNLDDSTSVERSPISSGFHLISQSFGLLRLVKQLLGGVSAWKGHLFHDSNIRKGSDA